MKAKWVNGEYGFEYLVLENRLELAWIGHDSVAPRWKVHIFHPIKLSRNFPSIEEGKTWAKDRIKKDCDMIARELEE